MQTPAPPAVPQLFERLAVLDTDIVGEALERPLGHTKTCQTKILKGNEMGDLVRA
jgi:hypothetical protein